MEFKSLPAFRGINNRLPPDRMREIGDRDPGAFVRDAVNVDLTAAGSFQRRPGVTRVGESTQCRSLFGAGDHGYFAAGDALMMRDDSGAEFELLTLPSAYGALSYAMTPHGVIVSDTYAMHLLNRERVEPLLPPPLNPEPTASVGGVGGLAAGTYAVAFASMNLSTGQRSVVTYPQEVVVPANGSINISAPGNTQLIAVFISAPDGSTLYHEATIAPGVTSLAVPLVSAVGEAVTYEYMQPLPAGQIIAYHFGRLISVLDSLLLYSAPFNLGLYRPSRDYLAMPDPITMVVPLTDGLIVCTAKGTWLLPGGNIADTSMQQLAPFGAVPGTLTTVPNSTDMMWFSERGPVRQRGGTITLLQDKDIAFAPAAAGAAIVREQNGLRQLITALSGNSPAAAAVVGSYMDAEVITGASS